MSTTKQLPSTISTEELLNELADKVVEDITAKPKKKRFLNASFVLKFLTVFNVEPGQDKIEQKIIYNLYKQYEKSQKPSKRLTEQQFFRTLKSYIKWEKRQFYINQKSLDLSERVLNFIKPETIAQTKVIPLQMHFQNFCKKFDIKLGKEPNNIWVSTKTLYDLYDEWVYSIRKKRPLGYNEFCNFCKIYFPKIKNGANDKTWLSLDDSIEQIMKARISYQNEQEEKKKPKK